MAINNEAKCRQYDADDTATQMRHVAVAGFIGTAIEFFDFAIYSIAASLVFAPLFFPQLGELASTVAAFGTIGVAFIFRPLGSILFGHIGDKLGRKSTLTLSLLMMGLATVLTGLLPTGQEIGIAAPISLVLLRVLQGLAAGGEFAGAVLILSENAPNSTRGAWSCIPNLGGSLALFSAGLTVALVSVFVGDQAFQDWAWRVPFLFSSILLVFGLYIRLRLEETPIFKNEAKRRSTQTAPLLLLLQQQSQEIILACLAIVPGFALLYLVVTFMASFGTTQLELGYTVVPAVMMVSGVGNFLGLVTGARLSDRIGRRKVLLIANGAALVWVLVVFPLLYSGTMVGYVAACATSIFIGGLASGPMGALLSELFRTRYRYTAVGLTYNGAAILGGAALPLIAEPLMAQYGHMAFGIFIAACFLVSVFASFALPESKNNSLNL